MAGTFDSVIIGSGQAGPFLAARLALTSVRKRRDLRLNHQSAATVCYGTDLTD